jgi:glutathione reductase (NADPH)
MEIQMFDLIVIGAGSGGLAAAKRAAAAGRSVVLIESDRMGGTCVSTGCVPKKLWHQVSMTRHQCSVANAHGWTLGHVFFDWTRIQPKLNQFIQSLNARHEQKCLDLGIRIIKGNAQLNTPTSVKVNKQLFHGKRILISVGANAQRLTIPGAELCDTSHEFFDWPTLPDRVVIVGGGYIAVELASILNGLGCQVELVIRKSRVLTGFDHDMQMVLQELYTKRGITIHINEHVQAVESMNGTLLVHRQQGNAISADRVILAIGRTPNTQSLGCKKAGVLTRADGAIIVTPSYETSVPSISAIGDCIGGIQLTPVAIAQAREWVDTVLLNRPFPVNYSVIPTAIFSHPEAASVGLSEAEARQQFREVSTTVLRFTPLTSALHDGEKEPVWIKLVFKGDNQEVCGIHMIGDASAEMIQCLAIAVQKGICKTDLDITMALHPSVAEELVTIY